MNFYTSRLSKVIVYGHTDIQTDRQTADRHTDTYDTEVIYHAASRVVDYRFTSQRADYKTGVISRDPEYIPWTSVPASNNSLGCWCLNLKSKKLSNAIYLRLGSGSWVPTFKNLLRRFLFPSLSLPPRSGSSAALKFL